MNRWGNTKSLIIVYFIDREKRKREFGLGRITTKNVKTNEILQCILLGVPLVLVTCRLSNSNYIVLGTWTGMLDGYLTRGLLNQIRRGTESKTYIHERLYCIVSRILTCSTCKICRLLSTHYNALRQNISAQNDFFTWYCKNRFNIPQGTLSLLL